MEKVEQYKQSPIKFIINEFVIFISQIIVFFMVAVFTSNFLTSEEKLVEFSNQKINDGTLFELGITFLAIFLVIGVFTAIGRVFENKYVDHYVNEILFELPKTIYVFGSATVGTMLAITLFLFNNPDTQNQTNGFAILSVFLGLMVFAYGCAFSYAFKRKTHIISGSNKAAGEP